MKKKITLLSLVFALALLVVVPLTAFADTGWVINEDGSKSYYYDDENFYQNGIWNVEGDYYYFDENGIVKTGFINATAPWDESQTVLYYANEEGILQTGWQKIDGQTYYFNESSNPYAYTNDYWMIDDNAYFFDENGIMKTGWCKYEHTDEWGTSTTWYYADANGVLQKDWQAINGKWYYLDPNSYYMYKGIREIKGKYYYFYDSGAMATGWIKQSGDNGNYVEWFYAESNGALVSGWKKIGNTWYYFQEDNYGYSYMHHNIKENIGGKDYYFYDNGAMATGWIKESYNNGNYVEWYYANSSGVLQKGWQKIGNFWYYFEENEDWGKYRMYSNRTGTINGKTYCFEKSGAMGIGWCKQVYDYDDRNTWTNWYYADNNGFLQSGWKIIGGVWYYFDPESYIMATGVWRINGKSYVFQSNGAWTTKAGWLSVTNGGYTSWYYVKSDGTPQTGWLKLNNKWYYFDEYGKMASNTTVNIKGKVYAFDKSGALISKAGWVKITPEYSYYSPSYWIYTNADGTAVTGWKQIGEAWYYFHPGYGRMISENYLINGKLNLFESNGKWIKVADKIGWYTSNSNWYYVESEDGSVAIGWREIKDKKYYFESDGRMVSNGQYPLYDDEGNETVYYFAESGELLTGFITTDWGEVYYADENGVLQTGPKTIDGNLYYFDEVSFGMYRWRNAVVDDIEYYFDENGIGTPVNQVEYNY